MALKVKRPPLQTRSPMVVDLDRLLGKVPNKILAVGIELEGRWKVNSPAARGVKRDGSVRFDGLERIPREFEEFPPQIQQMVHSHNLQREALGRSHLSRPQMIQLANDFLRQGSVPSDPNFIVGEIASPRLEIKEWKKWIKTYYPDDVNSSCGLHIHQSFKTAFLYQTLTTPAYQDTLIEYLKRWGEGEEIKKDHCFWERIEGKNTFCRPEFHAAFQMQQQSHSHANARDAQVGVPSRYTMVNYTWRMFKTVEVRVLPMFSTLAQSMRALECVMDVTNAFLAHTIKQPQKSIVRIEDHDPTYSTKVSLCV